MDNIVDTTALLWKQDSPSSTILRVLQQYGPSSVRQLEQTVGVSTNAVREQLVQLQAAALVQVTKQSHGAGRPLHLYSLTPRAQHLLSQGYDTLLNLLFAEILDQDGPAKLQILLHGVSERLAGEYAADPMRVAADGHLSAMQQAFAQHNMPLTAVEHDGELRLHTWSCPYIDVASEHRGVCDMETDMLTQVFGQRVHLEERIVDGATGCCFVVDHYPSSAVQHNISSPIPYEEQHAQPTVE
ncbi:MAG: hypothetical protein H0X37_03565 [Herpetosiphonaceae bacterium]|nr:hypothetical protein [Herpetosiphonaceae bacterium]